MVYATVEFNTVRNWIVLVLGIWLIGLVACQSDQLVTTYTTEAGTSINQETPMPTPSRVVTPSAVSRLTQLPIVTNTPSPVPISVPTISPLQQVAEWPFSISHFTLSKDAKLLASENLNTGVLYIFDTATGNIRWEIMEDNRGVTGYTLEFSPDGKLLAGAGKEQDLFVWDMSTGKTIYILPEPFDLVNGISFSSDSKLLAASTPETFPSDYGILVWDVSTGEVTYQFTAGEYGWYINDIVFVPSHVDLLAITTTNFNTPEQLDDGQKPGGLYLFSISNQQLQEAITGTFGLVIATSPNGQLIATYLDGDLRVWDIQRETEILRVPVGQTADTSNLALTNSGIIANLDTKGVLTIWNLQGELLGTLETAGTISDIAFKPNGDLLVASYVEGEARPIEVWRINN